MTDASLLVLRVAMGVVFIVHGWPKLNPGSPSKGVSGFAGFLKAMGVPLPTLFAWIVALLETVGAVLLIVGLGTRILAAGFAINMIVAILVAKIRFMKVGFVSGWELDYVLLAQALALLLAGSGAIGLDRLLGFS